MKNIYSLLFFLFITVNLFANVTITAPVNFEVLTGVDTVIENNEGITTVNIAQFQLLSVDVLIPLIRTDTDGDDRTSGTISFSKWAL